MELFLRFADVSKEFNADGEKPVRALQDISFEVGHGEFVSVLGPSGCGKSTILRLAAGLDFPTRGQVTIGRDVIRGPDRKRGFVFQSYSVFPWLTVQQNIAFGLTLPDNCESNHKVERWLDFTGLRAFAHAYPKTLSGGMRQRLALARTMIVEPELLLLDEPFGALDERTRQGMQNLLLQAVRDTGCSVIFVTHDIQEAILMADKLILLSKRPGRILNTHTVAAQKPRTREFLQDPEFVRLHGELLDQFPV